MSDQYLNLLTATPAAVPARTRLPLGRHLVENGIITQAQLVRALQMQHRLSAPLGEILVSEGWASAGDILTALAQQHGILQADLETVQPDPDLCDMLPFRDWLELRAVPWLRIGKMLMIATSRPDQFDAVRERLARNGTDQVIVPVLAADNRIDDALSGHFGQQLARGAATRVAPIYSCRDWKAARRLPGIAIVLAFVALGAWFPGPAVAAVFGAAVLSLLLFSTLKACAFVVHLLDQAHLTAPRPPDDRHKNDGHLPRVSVLVPLYKEREIASALIRRLGRLTYPKALLDVILVLEEKDEVTHRTLEETDLPNWMRVIVVPELGGLTTKPRAMNYALDFCRGDIIGVWDAEDAPVADQIEQVVGRFARAPDDVVCLQGILDYYNPRSSWRARCFTIEYASWFRVVLPGVAKMGLVVPLGGTTLFFRRDVLEELGGWDAHNVTEDADLGVRLCRAGYRTELIDTVTYEEANFRAWPWVRQRSRWLKGFMVTYLVHMRSPRRLLKDLGLRRFLGVQAFFLGTLGQFLLAPILWTFWLIPMGVDHPLASQLPAALMTACIAVFVATELLALTIGVVAVSSDKRRFLIPWVPTMPLYFPLGVIAAYKALWELAAKPFFWDKTQHGQATEETAPGGVVAAPIPTDPPPASNAE